jgi:aspartate carbamoyltransferase catalytic subunit
VLISPPELRIPSYVKHETIGKSGMEYVEVESLEEAMPELDVLYMTRIQKERFSYVEDYERLKDSYILTADKLDAAKSDLIVMHPLPRVNEISVAVDKDPRAKYFLQTLYGKYMRMALILFLLDEKQKNTEEKASPYRLVYDKVCTNTACICSTEQELPQTFKCVNEEEHIYRCIWCDSRAK